MFGFASWICHSSHLPSQDAWAHNFFLPPRDNTNFVSRALYKALGLPKTPTHRYRYITNWTPYLNIAYIHTENVYGCQILTVISLVLVIS